jgi:ATP-dependent DNA ligase
MRYADERWAVHDMRHRYHYSAMSECEIRVESGEWIAQPKVDGVWAAAFYRGGDKITVRGRRGKVIGFVAVEPCPDLSFIMTAEYRDGSLYVFDCLEYNGIDWRVMPFRDRLQATFRACVTLGSDEVCALPTSSAPRDLFKWTQQDPDMYDGIVLKRMSAVYDDEGFPHYKCKHSVTMDYVITGILYTPKGKAYAGWANGFQGALYIDGELVDVCKIPNLPHKMRNRATEDPNFYLGRVVEAMGQKVFPSGALRHPVYMRMRDDKDPSVCRWEPIRPSAS